MTDDTLRSERGKVTLSIVFFLPPSSRAPAHLAFNRVGSRKKLTTTLRHKGNSTLYLKHGKKTEQQRNVMDALMKSVANEPNSRKG